MKSPRGQEIGEISWAIAQGTKNTVDSKSDRAMLKSNRFVTPRMSFLLMMTIQTSALPKMRKPRRIKV